MAGLNGVPQQLSDMTSRFSYTATGKVIITDPFYTTVEIGTTRIRATYVGSTGPAAGDNVSVLRQGASWLVLGKISDSGGNSVVNPSFDTYDESAQPTGWTTYAIAGAPVVAVVDDASAADGAKALEVMAPVGAVSTSYVYSSAIACVTGQVWRVSAYVSGHYPANNPDTTDVSLRVLWFAGPLDLYPTTAAADTTVASVTNILNTDPMTLLHGDVTVPAGPAFLRVALRTAALQGAGAHWDFVTARRVS